MKYGDSVQGSPKPCGASYLPAQRAYNFALYSRHASAWAAPLRRGRPGDAAPPPRPRPRGEQDRARVALPVPEEQAAVARATTPTRSTGPHDGTPGHRFDPEKVLLDPYAPAVYFPPGFDRAGGRAARLERRPGAAGRAPAREARLRLGGTTGRPRHEPDTVIYEMHVAASRGARSGGSPPARRGTFAGVVEKIPYLKDLGVTIVELLPVHQFDPQEGNYWGYMPLNFFSPHHGYRAPRDPHGRIDEFRAMVKALHAGGHRGDARRRLQPHHRGRRRTARPTATAASTTAPTTCSPTTCEPTATTPAAATSCAPRHSVARS